MCWGLRKKIQELRPIDTRFTPFRLDLIAPFFVYNCFLYVFYMNYTFCLYTTITASICANNSQRKNNNVIAISMDSRCGKWKNFSSIWLNARDFRKIGITYSILYVSARVWKMLVAFHSCAAICFVYILLTCVYIYCWWCTYIYSYILEINGHGNKLRGETLFM